MTLDDILDAAPVIPVIVFDRPADAVPLAQALLRGGLRVLEVTLRTPAALDVLRAMQEVEGAIVGAGTVLGAAQYDEAVAAGARFVVSPGLTDRLAATARERAVPLLPGTATASEVMIVLERGYGCMKLFPAEAAGGVELLSSLASPLPTARFCPTGGIDPEKAKRYLALPNVVCVGGSWLVPRDAVRQGDWARITELARGTGALRQGGAR